jgi:hypothetical protein
VIRWKVSVPRCMDPLCNNNHAQAEHALASCEHMHSWATATVPSSAWLRRTDVLVLRMHAAAKAVHSTSRLIKILLIAHHCDQVCAADSDTVQAVNTHGSLPPLLDTGSVELHCHAFTEPWAEAAAHYISCTLKRNPMGSVMAFTDLSWDPEQNGCMWTFPFSFHAPEVSLTCPAELVAATSLLPCAHGVPCGMRI